MRYFLFTACLLLCGALLSQPLTIEGVVTDARDKSAMPYVNVYVKNSTIGTYTDAKGYYRLTVPRSGSVLVFSSLGYIKQEITITSGGTLNVKMKDEEIALDEVIITPGENPADAIMRLVTENRKKHDPENQNTFQYKSYNKFVVSINKKDSVDTPPPVFNSPADSALYYKNHEVEDMLLNKMNLFLMESVTEKKYRKPGKYKETVEASRISGLKNAEYVLLATQMQSFTFYSNYIKILGKEYLSPITEGNTRKYLFILQDTVEENGETLYGIYFQPRKGKNFEGLSGILYINSQNYAVLKAVAKVAEPSDGFSAQLVQDYTKMGEDTYFPTLFTSDFIFSGLTVEVGHSTGGNDGFEPLGKAKTTLYDIVLNQEIPRSAFDNVELDFDPNATRKDTAFWNKNRQDELTAKDSFTYVMVDSIGDKLNLDRKLEVFRALRTGLFPIGVVDIHLNDIINFNNFEGLRVGMGLSTNNRLSKRFSVGGYYAYGFKDVHSKYGGNFTLFTNNTQTSFLDAAYSSDVAETGMPKMPLYEVPQEEKLRNLYISVMDRVETSKATAGFRLLRYFTTRISAERVNKKATTVYRFGDGLQQYYRFANAVVAVRWAPGEKLVRSFGKLVPKETQGLVVNATITKSFDNVMDGQFDYLKTDIMADYQFRIRNIGRTYLRLWAGQIDGAAPYTEMYFGRAGFNNRNVSLVTPNSFETMRYNEFFSSRYAALFIRHNFGSLLFKYKKFKPEIWLVSNMMVGEITNPGIHKFYPLKPVDKGYYESGVQINNLLSLNSFSSYGIGLFYRYGPYTLPKTFDNMAIKLSATFSF